MFNDTNFSHAFLCKKYFDEIIQNKSEYVTVTLHENNDNTVDEAINFGNFFKNTNSELFIITNEWHKPRVKYLFEKTFEINEIKNYTIFGVNSVNDGSEIIKEESNKLNQLKEKPYGKWKQWLKDNYYDRFVKIVTAKKNKEDGEKIIKMRNQNRDLFFNNNKFEWESFKDIYFNKYFANEIPPFFVCIKNEIVGFIGCKTICKNVNDIGIMFFKQYQGLGIGSVSLKKFLKKYDDEINKNKNKIIISKILKTNIASFKIFISNGFKLNEKKTNNEIYYLTY